MISIGKGLIASTALAATTLVAATPAMAHDHDGIGAGEVIAGALVIGGIAAIAASASHDRDYYDRAGYDGYRGGYDPARGDNYGYYNRGNPRGAIEQCVRSAESAASRSSYGRADVTDIRDVRPTGDGYEVRGRIAVPAFGRDWRDGGDRYGRGWGGDYRGWNSSLRGYDSGSFRCRVAWGRVVDLDYRGIRGL